MGKSRKKPDSEADSDPAVVASPAALIANETQVLGSKKQKTENGDKDLEKNNFGKETEENTKEEQNKSSQENKVEVSPVIKPAETTQDANEAKITNEHEEKKGEDKSKEDYQHLDTPIETVEVLPAVTTQDTNTKRARISNDYEEEDEDDKSKEDNHHLETPMESVDVPSDIKSTTQDAKRARISNNEEQDRDDDSKKSGTDVEMLDDSSLKKTDQTELSSQFPGSKTVLMDNLSFLIKEEDVRKFFKNVGEIAEIHFEMKEDYFTGHGHVKFMTAEAAQEAVKLSNTSLLDRHVKLHLATESGEEHPTTTPHTTGSKTLYVGNLSFSIEEDDVRDFFKDVGEIAAIRFAIKNDRFLGYGYIEFTTSEGAQEALKLNQGVILDRKVYLDLARERGAYTPSNSFEKSNQRGGHAQGRTLYVRGFDYSRGYDNIRSTLEKHFGKCGEITRIHIPQDYDLGGPRGVAFIDFPDNDAFSQALKLDKSEIGGCKIIVEEAKRKKGDGREGYGHGGGSGGGWGRDGGSGGGESRGYDYGGGSSRASGGWHREGSWHGDGGWHREGGSRGSLGSRSGYGGDWSGGGGGGGSSRVGRFSGGSRGGGGSRR
ncbi:hypothetical protein LXL04_009911 [Taraxacum kok-saghyz]